MPTEEEKAALAAQQVAELQAAQKAAVDEIKWLKEELARHEQLTTQQQTSQHENDSDNTQHPSTNQRNDSENAPISNKHLANLCHRRTQSGRTLLKIQQEVAEIVDPDESYLEVKEQVAVTAFETFEETSGLYVALMKTDFDDELEDMRIIYQDILIQLKRMFRRIEPDSRSSTGSSVDNASTGNSAGRNNIAKLPKINLPKFNGELDGWLSFKNLWMALVGDNPNVKPTLKLNYLLSSLESDPKNLIRNLPLDKDESYTTAWDKLTQEYENSRTTVTHYFDSLLDLPNSKREASNLKSLLNKVTTIIETLNGHDFILSDKFSDQFVSYIVSKRLDEYTRQRYEQEKNFTFAALQTFLKNEIQILQAVNSTTSKVPVSKSTISSFPRAKSFGAFSADFKRKCRLCSSEEHNHAARCDTFKSADISKRWEMVKINKLCINCLFFGHNVTDCRSKRRCFQCSKQHNTLLHNSNSKDASNVNKATHSNSASSETTTTAISGTLLNTNCNFVLLRTALVRIERSDGTRIACRALLDNGSQLEFISRRLQRKLDLPVKQHSGKVQGIVGSAVSTHETVNMTIISQSGDFQLELQAVVLEKLAGPLPQRQLNVLTPEWKYIWEDNDIELADPKFHIPCEIDLLLGERVLSQITLEGIRRGPMGYPIMHNTKLGWCIGGGVPLIGKTSRVNDSITGCALDQILTKFWCTEEIPVAKERSPEEKFVEEHFENTYSLKNGRFNVTIPLKNEIRLGESRNSALRQFLSLEKRGIPDEYRKFMNDYVNLGHMRLKRKDETAQYYVPHHAVYKDGKIRVVFNASCPSSSGYSFNDLQYTGPVVQPDIFEVLSRFRTKTYVFTCDIEKMYRQILVDPTAALHQVIWWRSDPSHDLLEYCLVTITYGTKAASYLATKCLVKLAELERKNFPAASKAVKNESYIDDVCTGANTLSELNDLKHQLIDMMAKAGLKLSKWQSNSPEFLDKIPERDQGISKNLDIEARALGMEWRSRSDVFAYSIRAEENIDINQPITKRKLLSRLAKVFDPLGLISPVVVIGKGLLQRLWKLEKTWDEPLELDSSSEYLMYLKGLSDIAEITVGRCVHLSTAIKYGLIGFADASELAYAAAVYLRVETSTDIRVNLIAAKTKIASIEKTTIPRLELNAAVLLVKLAEKIASIYNVPSDSTYLFSDSTIVLAWIKKSPDQLKTFVANRVSRIQRSYDIQHWNHVSSMENPADIASRGCSPSALASNKLWWFGPQFVYRDLPVSKSELVDCSIVNSELKPVKPLVNSCAIREPSAVLHSLPVNNLTNVNTGEPSALCKLIDKSSNFVVLINIVAFMLRFCNNSRKSHLAEDSPFVTVNERNQALIVLCRHVQLLFFRSEIFQLANGHLVTNQLQGLHPRLDDNGLLRLGGRLSNANVNQYHRWPIILPKSHHLTRLIIRYTHEKYLHAGATLTTNLLRQKYWIFPGGRNLIRKMVRNCTKCQFVKNSHNSQIMGDLPSHRVQEALPFSYVGVDYAGPINITFNAAARPRISVKAWIAVFVCLTTKAVHLELATDMTMDTFLAAFRRFIARRGVPIEMNSDNGTNFTAAANELTQVYKFFRNNFDRFSRFFQEEGISWKFIPVRTPHMGGIWESAVKSVKIHLKAMLGSYLLTYEEFYTLLAQIEGCLNSRPLVKLNEDPENVEVLTPGHFLVGRPVMNLPEPAVQSRINFTPSDVKERWKLLQHVNGVFWRKFTIEYLSELQLRNKWRKPSTNLKIDQYVILREYSEPGDWPLGRIVSVYPDQHGTVRLCDVKTRRGIVRKHVRFLVPFLSELD